MLYHHYLYYIFLKLDVLNLSLDLIFHHLRGLICAYYLILFHFIFIVNFIIYYIVKIILQNNIARNTLVISVSFNNILMSATGYCSAAKRSNSVMPFLVKHFWQGLWFLKFCRNRVIRHAGRFAVLVSVRRNIPSSGFHISFFSPRSSFQTISRSVRFDFKICL